VLALRVALLSCDDILFVRAADHVCGGVVVWTLEEFVRLTRAGLCVSSLAVLLWWQWLFAASSQKDRQIAPPEVLPVLRELLLPV